jgi:cell division protein YceG involved in septum cleavage
MSENEARKLPSSERPNASNKRKSSKHPSAPPSSALRYVGFGLGVAILLGFFADRVIGAAEVDLSGEQDIRKGSDHDGPRGKDGPDGRDFVELRINGPEDAMQRLPKSMLSGLWLRIHLGQVPAGYHVLPRRGALRDVAARLERRGPKVKVTFPEGYTSFDMAKRMRALGIISRTGFLDATRDPKLVVALLGPNPRPGAIASMEGYLFPATYEFPANLDGEDAVRRMKQEFDKRTEGLFRPTAGATGYTVAQIVNLASLVEKEAAAAEERPVIASVFYNRLNRPDFSPRYLQSDPTSMYGCVRALELHKAESRSNGEPPSSAGAVTTSPPAIVVSTAVREGQQGQGQQGQGQHGQGQQGQDAPADEASSAKKAADETSGTTSGSVGSNADMPPSCVKYAGKATRDIVHDAKNPFSTYSREGLPPSPICNPGARALEAATHPQETPYLYFVARGEGRHAFTATYKEHMDAIKAQRK